MMAMTNLKIMGFFSGKIGEQVQEPVKIMSLKETRLPVIESCPSV